MAPPTVLRCLCDLSRVRRLACHGFLLAVAFVTTALLISAATRDGTGPIGPTPPTPPPTPLEPPGPPTPPPSPGSLRSDAPLVVAFSGGGLRAMTGAAAVATALASMSSGNAWPNVTHLATTSGSSWFAALFLFDPSFYASVTGATLATTEVTDRLSTVLERYYNDTTATQSWRLETLRGSCAFVDTVVDDVLDELMRLEAFLGGDWDYMLDWFASAFRVHGTVRDLPRVRDLALTSVQGMTLPPNAYAVEQPGDTGTLVSILDEAGEPVDYSIPIAASIDSERQLEWMVKGGPSQTFVDGSGAARRVVLPANPPAPLPTAGSSAFLGALASLRLCEQVALDAANAIVRPCDRVSGWENLAAGFAVEGVSYAFIDALYTDSTAVAFGVARMQKDCGYGTDLDVCERTPRVVAVDFDKNDGARAPKSLRRLFEPPDGTPVINRWSAPFPFWKTPLITVFDAPPPPLSAFQPYNANRSRFWTGRVTTRTNEWYGVRGGQTIDLLVILPQTGLPLIPWVTPQNRAQTPSERFRATYADVTAEQARAVEPVLRGFLDGD